MEISHQPFLQLHVTLTRSVYCKTESVNQVIIYCSIESYYSKLYFFYAGMRFRHKSYVGQRHDAIASCVYMTNCKYIYSSLQCQWFYTSDMWNNNPPLIFGCLHLDLPLAAGFFPAGIQTDSVLSARLQIIRIYIREDGRLVIEFKTHAKFRGQFPTSTVTFQTYKYVYICCCCLIVKKHYTVHFYLRARKKKNSQILSSLQVSLSLSTTRYRVTRPTWCLQTTSEASSLTFSCCGALKPSTLRTSCGGPPAPTAGQSVHPQAEWEGVKADYFSCWLEFLQHTEILQLSWTGIKILDQLLVFGKCWSFVQWWRLQDRNE